jgi:hypothetical protein
MTYRTEVLADNPTGFWEFEETTGTSAADSSGNGYTATVINCNLDVAGPVGSGVGFNGTDSRVVLGEPNTNAALGAWTWELWLNAQENGAVAGIMGEMVHGGDATLLRLSPGTGSWSLQVVLNQSGTTTFISRNVASLPYNTTMHLVVTIENAQTTSPTIRVYRDGAQIAVFTNVTHALVAPWKQQNLGTRDSSTHRYMGTQAVPAFYTYALSATRVASHFAAASGPSAPTGLTVAAEGAGLRSSWTSGATLHVLERERWTGAGTPP